MLFFLLECIRKKTVYGCDLDGVVTANGEVRISGFTAYILSIEEIYNRHDHMGRQAVINTYWLLVTDSLDVFVHVLTIHNSTLYTIH
jgi:hypothetical protein